MENEYKLWILNIIISQLRNKNGTKTTPILKSEFNTFGPVMENEYIYSLILKSEFNTFITMNQ